MILGSIIWRKPYIKHPHIVIFKYVVMSGLISYCGLGYGIISPERNYKGK